MDGIQPSEKARAAVRGGYDLHVHVAPDLLPRKTDDLTLARRCLEVGLKGFVLKSHYAPTAERAALVRQAVPGVNALGAIVLNRAVGGLNPVAVEVAARAGARFVWLPTVDALNEAHHLETLPPGKRPQWARLQEEFRRLGLDLGPVEVLDERGHPLPELKAVLEAVARHGLVLATGHLSRREIFPVVEAALEAGVRFLVITHPDYPTQDLPLPEQRELARMGAFLERCFVPSYTGKVPWERVFRAIEATGPERNVLSTDLGQPQNPPVEEGLALFADRLLQAGFDEGTVRQMAVENTVFLAEGGKG
ncbi:hypothetical protein Theos_2228 (plasmid) [Thermus oshimai JL-2]|uniref:Cytosolic protein n=1 Tax=Thermus oshimai JL-2 TaxID=751945 RepID=K7R853_THEOS|nr:DUF6282 family protein [Thermus oshimai]AFV77219.1 hypothetical protein Theos_2228 [Thermus oshimai JL-2]